QELFGGQANELCDEWTQLALQYRFRFDRPIPCCRAEIEHCRKRVRERRELSRLEVNVVAIPLTGQYGRDAESVVLDKNVYVLCRDVGVTACFSLLAAVDDCAFSLIRIFEVSKSI